MYEQGHWLRSQTTWFLILAPVFTNVLENVKHLLNLSVAQFSADAPDLKHLAHLTEESIHVSDPTLDTACEKARSPLQFVDEESEGKRRQNTSQAHTDGK